MMQQEFIDQADESPRSLLKAGQEDLYLALVFGFQLEMGSCFLIHQALYRCSAACNSFYIRRFVFITKEERKILTLHMTQRMNIFSSRERDELCETWLKLGSTLGYFRAF